ncbi:MAG: hypothetical protein QW416_00095 [Candidatus Nitrosocaldaceae archaeon]
MISTNVKSLDILLNGGVRYNTLINIYGENGSGKTQFCFHISAYAARSLGILFIDSLNNFRPERVIEIADKNVLENIYVIRPSSIDDAYNTLRKANYLKVRLIIIDDISELVFDDINPEERLVWFIHKILLLAIKYELSVIITNRIAYDTRQKYDYIISRYTHFKIKFSKINGIHYAHLLHPYDRITYFRIGKKGLVDVYL